MKILTEVLNINIPKSNCFAPTQSCFNLLKAGLYIFHNINTFPKRFLGLRELSYPGKKKLYRTDSILTVKTYPIFKKTGVKILMQALNINIPKRNCFAPTQSGRQSSKQRFLDPKFSTWNFNFGTFYFCKLGQSGAKQIKI